MRSYVRTTTGLALDADGLAAAQNPAEDTALVLEAAAAHLDPPRRVTLTSGADVSGATFLIVGKDRAGTPISETITGPSATTVTSAKVYASVESITASATVAEDVEAGWSAEVIGGWLFLGHLDSNAAWAVDVSGTVNYDIERTFRNIMREGINGDEETVTEDLASNETGADSGVIEGGVGALRIVQNSGTGSVRLRVIPARGM